MNLKELDDLHHQVIDVLGKPYSFCGNALCGFLFMYGMGYNPGYGPRIYKEWVHDEKVYEMEWTQEVRWISPEESAQGFVNNYEQ